MEIDDIFGDQMQEDEDQLPQMLPDLPDGLESEIQGTQNDEEAENQEVLKKLKSMKGASKNSVKRPMPKLDSMRLTGERGIPILPRVFKDVKLKSKGHEVDDLKVMMRYLEHWAHRLFPMMPFDEVLARIERLGTKRDVQTCIKKMRLGMPVLGSDTVGRSDDEKDSDGDADDGKNKQQKIATAEDLFDAMLRDEDPMADLVKTNGQANSPTACTPCSSTGNRHSPSSQTCTAGAMSGGLTPQMMERMERNKRLAMQRRARKLDPGSTASIYTAETDNGESSYSGQTADGSKGQEQSLQDVDT